MKGKADNRKQKAEKPLTLEDFAKRGLQAQRAMDHKLGREIKGKLAARMERVLPHGHD